MKQVSLFFIGLSFALSLGAQQNLSALTITVNGNKNLQITVDGRDYYFSNNEVTGNNTTILLNNLEEGQHSFLATRTNNINRQDRTSATFNLRYGYDMLLKVNGNGSLELIETRKTGISDNQIPMSDAAFSTLVKSVKKQRSASGIRGIIANAFNKTNNYFTTSQVVQLLRLVKSESFRLQLAKLSYHSITDRNNFSQVFDLLNSKASENELKDYVNNYNEDIDRIVAMSDAGFNSLHQNIKQQWPVSIQMNSLTNAFNNTNNNFTASQAKQLIQLISAENNRLQLAKLSYSRIVDQGNFIQIYDLFYSLGSINELQAYVNNYNTGIGSNVAMSDVNFNSLHKSIQQQWPVSTQVSSLTNAFNNANNNFTTYQARQLIQIIAAESSRLQLAKSSYRSITDPANFSQLNNLFNSQASIIELAVYVNNYNAGSGTNVAMSDINFNLLHQSIQQQWPVSTQVSSLTNVFAISTNYFTTFQARQLIQIIAAESSRLQLAKSSYRSITDLVNFSQMNNLFNSQASINELAVYVNNYNAGSGTNVAMSDINFNSLYQNIQQQSPVSTQVITLANTFAISTNYFTTYQARQLIQIIAAESNRLHLAKSSYRSITDPANFSQMNNLFSSQASKNELSVFVTNYNTGNNSVAMSDAGFKSLYQTIQGQFFPNERMNSLTDAFNNSSNYFTTIQVKQLIRLIAFESNRLQLTKLSYRTITDRINFTQLYDLLNTQASRDELDAYIKEYKVSHDVSIN